MTAHWGSIVELRKFDDAQGRRRVALAVRSDLSIEAQITANGATWLDRQAVAKEPVALGQSGFGAEVRAAMDRRAEELIRQGLAERQSRGLVFTRNLLDTLRKREIQALGDKLAAETKRPFSSSNSGEYVTGTYRQRFALASGRYAMIDDGLGFQLVPWSPSLEKQLGRHVPASPAAMAGSIGVLAGGGDWAYDAFSSLPGALGQERVGRQNPLGSDRHRLSDRFDDDLGSNRVDGLAPGFSARTWPALVYDLRLCLLSTAGFFWWWFSFDAYAPRIFVEGGAIAASGGLISIVVAIALSVWRAREAKSVSTYGSARWARPDEVQSRRVARSRWRGARPVSTCLSPPRWTRACPLLRADPEVAKVSASSSRP